MIFNKIKLNYNIKLLDDYFSSKEYDKIKNLLIEKLHNTHLFAELNKYIQNKYLYLPEHLGLINQKFIWLSSYDDDDVAYIKNFLRFYFERQKLNFLNASYNDCFDKTIAKLNDKNLQNFFGLEDIISNSYFYHFLIQLLNSNDFFILDHQSAFFEAPDNKFLIYPNTTIAYFHVVNNPYKLYLKYKNDLNDHQQSINKIHYFDEKENLAKFENNKNQYSILEMKQNWNVNTRSWTDENVKNSYRGKIIMYEDLISSPKDVLMEIVYHLKQYGVPLEVEYDLIDNYIDDNPLKDLKFNLNHSNNEIKMLSNSLDKNLMEDLDVKFDH